MAEEQETSKLVAQRAPTSGSASSEAALLDAIAGIAVVGLDRHGEVTSWNRAAERMIGVARAEAIGSALTKLPFAAGAEGELGGLLDATLLAGTGERTMPFLRTDGSRWLGRVTASAVRSEALPVSSYVLTIQETQSLAGDARTAPPPAQLAQLLVDTVQDYAIFSLDPTGRVTSWNRGAERIKGYAASEIVGKHFSVFYQAPEIERGWPEEELRRATDAGTYEEEGWRIRKDGSRMWAHVTITAIRDASGELLGFSKVTRDLTERLRHEEALRQREEDYRLLVEGIQGHAMFSTDVQGRIKSWNAGAQRLLGYAANEVLGHPTSMLYPEADRNSAQFRLALEAAKLHGQVQFKAWRQRVDGKRLWVEITSTAVRDEDGECRGFVQVIRDLTMVARVEALESEGRRTTEFIAMLSHELRNPLAPIRNAVAVLKRHPANVEKAEWCADLIDRQSTHLARLVDDLLDVSRITSGKIRVENNECDLLAVVSGAIESVKPLIAAKHHTFSMSHDRERFPLIGDAVRLTQVVVNLLTNAVKYTESPGNIDISLHTDKQNNAVLRVKDNGIGMSSWLLEHAFEPFVQGEQALARSQGGLGMGLSLVKSVVQLHGGAVVIESAGEGTGTTVTVRLPLGNSHLLTSPPPIDARPETLGLRVLVVDDNSDAADSLAMALRFEGHQVEVAYDGPGGLRLAEEQRPDVAILDIGLPGMDGYQLAQRIRSTAGLQHMKLIAITGYGQTTDKEMASIAGFEHHFTKPASVSSVLALVRSMA